MTLVDVLTILVIVLVLYTFLPQGLRDGAGPVIHRAANAVRAVARPVFSLLGRLLRWIFGVPPRERVSTVSEIDAREALLERALEGRTNGRTDGRTEPDPGADVLGELVRRFELDRSRANLIALIVYTGGGTEDVRRLVKGGNGNLGAEVRAAKELLADLEPEPIAETPIAGRRYDPRRYTHNLATDEA
jgi:hypothetical protein